MTKELQTIQRRIFEQAATLPRTDVFGQQARGLFAVGQMGAMAAEQLSIEGAAIKGIEAASAEEGAPRKLAPGVTKATRAYNQSYLNTQTSLLVNGNESQKLEAMRQMQMRGIKPNSVAEMGAIFKAIDEGTLKGANPEVRAMVALKLNESSLSNLNKVANAVTAHDLEVIKQKTTYNYSKSLEKLREAHLTGGDKQQAFNDALESIQDVRRLNPGVTEVDVQKMRDQLKRVVNESVLEKEYLDSVVAGGEEGGVAYIGKFISSDRDDMSVEEKDAAKSFLLKLHTARTNELNLLSTVGYNNINNTMANNPGKVYTIDEINQMMIEQESKGFKINLAQENNLKSKSNTANKAAAKVAQTNAEIGKAILGKEYLSGKFTSKELDQYYKTQVENAINIAQAKAQAGEIQPIPSWQIEAQVAAGIPESISSFTSQLNSKLTNKSMNNWEAGLMQYSFLMTENQQALDKLPDQTKAFADTMLERSLNVGPDTNLATVYDDTYRAMYEIDDDVRNARSKNLSDWKRSHPTAHRKNAAQAFNMRGFFTPNIPDEKMAQFDRHLSINARLYESKDLDLAVKKTIDDLQRIYQPSPKFAPKGDTVPNPVENLPFYGFGNIVENQAANALNEIVTSQAQFEGQLPQVIKPSSKMKQMGMLTDDEKFYENYAENGFWLNIDGVDCKVYFISPNFGQVDPFAPNIYQVMYGYRGPEGKDKETLRPLKTMQRRPNGEYGVGVQMSTFYPPQQYIPGLMRRMEEEGSSLGFEQAARRRLEKDQIGMNDFTYRDISWLESIDKRIEEELASGTFFSAKLDDKTKKEFLDKLQENWWEINPGKKGPSQDEIAEVKKKIEELYLAEKARRSKSGGNNGE